MNITIDQNLEFKAKAKLDITVLDTNFKWVSFYLTEKLNINSVKLSDEAPLPFYKSEKGSNFWIKLPSKTEINQELTILVDYQGDILDRIGDYNLMETSIGWYPSTGYKQKAIFDLTFTTPNNYEFVSVGDLITNDKVDKNLVSHWVTPYKIRNASFNIGDFRKKKFDSKGFQKMEILYIDDDQLDEVIEDAKYSVELFSKLFGPIPPKKLTITELPAFHGEAFPGLLHLSHNAFRVGANSEGFYEGFCAHEVSHQWWGINLDFESYHDQWLSEGLASYSSLIYLQAVMEDKKLFYDFLDKYKKDIVEARTAYLGKSIPPGPISLGYRNNSSKTENDYSIIVYEKGAWVCQMLRNFMLDVNKMDESRFLRLLKEFYQENAGKSVTTADFQKKAESIMDEDLDWFFDQWVYGYKIPKYKFAYTSEKTPEGYFRVKCRVEQSEVPEDFQMYVIFKIDFGDNKIVRLKQKITGEFSEFDLPLMDKKPKDVIFNDLQSVLCEVEKVSW